MDGKFFNLLIQREMSQALIAKLTKSFLKDVPQLRTGYTVRVHQKIKEGDKERVQIFEGLIIKKSGGNKVGETITVRKISDGVGVEKIFPVNSPNIVKIEVVKVAKVRRSKLYYMRERFGKSARLKERQISQEEQKALVRKIEKDDIKVETATEEKVEAQTEAPVVETAAETIEVAATETNETPIVETEAEVEEKKEV